MSIYGKNDDSVAGLVNEQFIMGQDRSYTEFESLQSMSNQNNIFFSIEDPQLNLYNIEFGDVQFEAVQLTLT